MTACSDCEGAQFWLHVLAVHVTSDALGANACHRSRDRHRHNLLPTGTFMFGQATVGKYVGYALLPTKALRLRIIDWHAPKYAVSDGLSYVNRISRMSKPESTAKSLPVPSNAHQHMQEAQLLKLWSRLWTSSPSHRTPGRGMFARFAGELNWQCHALRHWQTHQTAHFLSGSEK